MAARLSEIVWLKRERSMLHERIDQLEAEVKRYKDRWSQTGNDYARERAKRQAAEAALKGKAE